MGAGRRTGPDEGRGFGVATAAAGALFVALLFAAPLLFLKIGEVRQRLDGLLRHADGLKRQRTERCARVRGALDRHVDQASRECDETLTHVERALDRMLPRPLADVRLPEALPMPAPAAAPDPAPAPDPASAPSAETPSPRPQAPPARSARAEKLARAWCETLARELGLTVAQQEQARGTMENYIVAVEGRAERARNGEKANVYADVQAHRSQAIQSIQGILTAEQAAKYKDFVDTAETWRPTGVVLMPLPGTLRLR